MSVESVLARVATIEQAIANPAALLVTNAAGTGGTAVPAAPEPTQAGGSSFAQALQSANESQSGTATPTNTAPASIAPTSAGGLETATPLLGVSSAGALTSTPGISAPRPPRPSRS